MQCVRGMRALLSLCLAVMVASCVDDVTTEEVVTESSAVTIPPGTHAVTLVERAGVWDYYDRGGLTDTTWRTGGCPNGCLIGGQAPLGYGETYLHTVIGYGGDANHKYTTTYFRHYVPPTPGVRALVLRVMYDDGFVFYLNGKEGGRAAMPSGTITSGTYSTGHEAGNRYVEFDITAQIPRLSATNTNYLAFEVHQASASSSDLVFDAELIAYVDGAVDDTTQEGIPAQSTWHYYDQGAAPAGWNTPAFDDAGWSSGQAALGFGESYIKTQTRSGGVTTYFRKHFTREGAVDALEASVMYDDGFVAYLNGHEVGRAAMPSGTVGPTTLSSGHEAAGYQTFDWSNGMPWLVEGTNVLAVEVHQNAASSSDLVFDLELELGSPWVKQASGVTGWLSAVATTGAQHAWAVGMNGTIIRTTDGGATWTAQASGTTAWLLGIDFADATHAWIVGENGTVLASTDAGATWQAQATGLTSRLGSVDFVDANTGWIAGGEPWDGDAHDDDGVYKTTDGGVSWIRQRTGAHSVREVVAADANVAYASGSTVDDGFVITKTTDGGATWTEVYVDVDAFNRDGTDLELLDANTLWWVGYNSPHDDSGEVKVVTRDGGATWQAAPRTSMDMGVDAIDFVDVLHGWAVTSGGGIIVTDDGGETWEIQRVSRLVPGADRVIGEAPYYGGIVFADALHGWAVGSADPADGKSMVLHTRTGGW